MSMSPEGLAMLKAHGAPYPSTVAAVGGRPTVLPDIPVLAVFIVFYATCAAGNMATLQLNLRKGHKFLPSGLLFGFCMARILTCALRMALATHPSNVPLAIAANIFLAAGILLVYVINILFAQRILRAKQPKLGWSLPLKALFVVLYALVGIFLVLLIVFTVYQSYTLEAHWRQVSHNVQLGAATYFVIVTAAPLIILAVAWSVPASPTTQSFGKSSLAVKSLIVAVSSTLCLLSAGFKAGIAWESPRPISNPAWYQSKACLYVFYFMIEVLILIWFLAMRVDQRFHVPDGSSKRKSYEVELSDSRQQHGTDMASDLTSDSASEKEVNV